MVAACWCNGSALTRRPVAHVAKEMGISRQCAHRWVARFDAEGDAGLHDRSSRPRSSPNATPAEVEARVLACRDTQRVGRDEVARRTGVPARTVSRILARHGRPPLAWLDPTTGQLIRASRSTALRYERDAPGDLIHVDVKKLGRIPDGGGWRAHGRSERPNWKRGLGFDYVHAAVDDHSRLAYAEVLPDEKGATAAGFLLRAAGVLRRARHPGPRGASPTTPSPTGTRSPSATPSAFSGPSSGSSSRTAPGRTARWRRFNRTLQAEWAYRQPVHQQHRTSRRPCPLARALQHSTSTHRTRRPPAHQPRTVSSGERPQVTPRTSR